MRLIALEEHFTTPAFIDGPGRAFKDTMARAAKLFEQLADLGDRRVADMDEAGIAMQVLSLNYPGTEQSDADEAIAVARDANDIAAAAVRKYPTRFAAFAALPVAAPDKAADELERCVRQYGFKGANINGHNRGRYLDDKFYWPILERAQALEVPIYLHPTLPPKPVIEASFGGFAPNVTFMLAGPAWGWHIETGVHVVRMMFGGVFDRFPNLQFVVGHMGEALPFMLPRLEAMGAGLAAQGVKLQRSFGDCLRQNLHYTFSGFNFATTFQNLLAEVGIERIMFSADYPYGSMTQAHEFLEGLPIGAADRERIGHGNAEALLRI
jgi:predicted TIM-barrel fold metal-dependent hydrolase